MFEVLSISPTLRDMIEQEASTQEISRQAVNDGFPPLVMRMIQVGESSGKLDQSLQKVSQYYDKEVPASIKKMFAFFEPMLIILMGVVVLIIALAIFLPIYKLTSTIGAQR